MKITISWIKIEALQLSEHFSQNALLQNFSCIIMEKPTRNKSVMNDKEGFSCENVFCVALA